MSEPAAIDDHKLRRFIAAYKLRLAEKAAELGARQETWGRQNSISIEAEKKHLTQQDKYRIAPYPYPGLRAFDTEEGELFFGREQNVKALREILAKRRLVVVLGGSGSGKSSLVRAGLLPFLNTEHRIPGRDGNWYAVEFRPRTDPLGELSTALVSQLLVPFLKLGRKGLPEALGLSRDADVTSEGTIALLQERMRQRFVEAKKHSREKVLETLLQIVNNELDSYDDIATSGRRLADPNLFLLVDQLEEVFRPEVDDKQREALLDLIVDLHEHMKSATTKGGLFLAATIRSEEVHRCAEHRGLSEVVIGSGYQIEILDPSNKDDALALRRAIVAPARNVLEDWGFSVPADDEDAPFEKGLPELLLKGAARLSKELDHRPDQLPLLQHALQAVWHAAMRRWSKPDAQLSKLEISLDDLPGQAPEWYAADPNASLETRPVPDLSACLQARADKAGNRAAERFADATGTTPDVGNDALQGAFRALARRDDRGNWARRFAGREEITAFLNADPDSAVAQLPDDKKWQALRDALHVFQLRGYMSRGAERKYDISHEALIRNWPLFQAWLRAPEEVAYALGRVLMEVKPEDFNKASSKEQDKMIPDNLAERVEAAAPFTSVSDLSRRADLSVEQVEALATAGALECLGLERRQALWQAGVAATEREGMLPGTSALASPHLPGMSAFELMATDVAATGVTHNQQPMELVRASLADVLPASQLPHVPDGTRVRIAGIITHRQRPRTASGLTFLGVEDETGLMNVMVSPGLWSRHRVLARTARAMIIRGIVQNATGAVSVVADKLEPLDFGEFLSRGSRDFR